MPKKISPLFAMATTTDIIELHILQQLYKLQQQNSRMRTDLSRSGKSAHVKELSAWKPYDFYYYFCTKYQEQYTKEYHLMGNEVRAYERIEAFQRINKISNEEYKEFIDLAFSRYFNFAIIPVIGNICSASLYEYLMGVKVKKTTVNDLQQLDIRLAKENEEIEKYLQEEIKKFKGSSYTCELEYE